MNIIVCIDDNNGMLFNNRRQSQDRILREKIISMCGENRLWMNPYTFRQFAKMPDIDVCVSESFMDEAEENDYCFIENTDIISYRDQIGKIILARWNRDYPQDVSFPTEIMEGFSVVSSEEFEGSSHEKITLEVYER